ncbi:YwqG family protein [Campylobacter sp.]|uniref:YwqG family protein n=1 Tax=Campylobacter sp. TaxID=205 RepID=UPI002705F461|nr:YwqG family protein [Campylobacter sp.]
MNLEKLKDECEKLGILRAFDELKKYARNAIVINQSTTDDKLIKIGSSKFGGLPDLPKNIEWFKNETTKNHLHFIAQINFSEVKKYDLEDELPNSGILYLFYDCIDMPWGYDFKDRYGKKVFYFDGNLSELERKSAPENTEIFDAMKLSFSAEIELPDHESDLIDTDKFNDEETDKIYDIQYEFYEENGDKILGHSNNIQDGMELECELVTNGLYCGDESGYNDPIRFELEKNVANWKLLLQIDSNEENGMMWCDYGKIYLWITKQNLKDRNFQDSWLILQCD